MAELFFDLQLFAEGAGGAEGGAPATGENAEAPTAQGEQIAEAPTAEEDRKAQFAKFKADFESEYKAEMQNAIKDRLKKSKAVQSELQGKLDKLSPIIDAFAGKYGVDAADIDGLLKAVEDDDQMYENEAYERGMTVEQLKAFRKLERENRELRMAEQRAAEQAQYAEWDRQFDELKQIYPGVDPQIELQNDSFTRLMNAGVPIRDAFELVHKEELTRGAMQFTANKVQEKLVNAQIANSARPDMGNLSGAASVAKPNIANMSLDQMRAYIQRSKAGESIDLVNNY